MIITLHAGRAFALSPTRRRPARRLLRTWFARLELGRPKGRAAAPRGQPGLEAAMALELALRRPARQR